MHLNQKNKWLSQSMTAGSGKSCLQQMTGESADSTQSRALLTASSSSACAQSGLRMLIYHTAEAASANGISAGYSNSRYCPQIGNMYIYIYNIYSLI
jgi:hypothetical protein